MRFSIITPTYNSVRTLERTIQSVIAQKEEELEYIVVDGGSTDGTLDVVAGYSDHVSQMISEADDGVYDAMNKGIAMASGEVVGIINSDDYYLDGALADVAAAAVSDPRADVYYGDILYDCAARPPYRVPSTHPLDPQNLLEVAFSHPATFVRRSAYAAYGVFDTHYRIVADYELIYRYLSAGARFHYVDAALAYMLGGGMSSRNDRRMRDEHRKLFLRYNHDPSQRARYELRYALAATRARVRELPVTQPFLQMLYGRRRKRSV
jgi:glycosyltransferase involved in cell wall biosynthesis